LAEVAGLDALLEESGMQIRENIVQFGDATSEIDEHAAIAELDEMIEQLPPTPPNETPAIPMDTGMVNAEILSMIEDAQNEARASKRGEEEILRAERELHALEGLDQLLNEEKGQEEREQSTVSSTEELLDTVIEASAEQSVASDPAQASNPESDFDAKDEAGELLDALLATSLAPDEVESEAAMDDADMLADPYDSGGDLLEALLGETDPLEAIEQESIPPDEAAPEQGRADFDELISPEELLETLIEDSLAPTAAPAPEIDQREAGGEDAALADALSSMFLEEEDSKEESTPAQVAEAQDDEEEEP
ncbi:MAG: hypothetical protein VYD19_02395, partial [Myxococcota bacterium]|nr:hypothetical protein [Myxococcota bacterium]